MFQLSLTHTSFRTNYGTNSAHARNSLTNCGLRQVEYGDRRVYYQNTRKRGINILVDIMSRMGKKEETTSEIPHNERLEFLGDAVVEFLSSVHLFYMFPWLEEGGLSTYRTAIVQNQHLAVLAKVVLHALLLALNDGFRFFDSSYGQLLMLATFTFLYLFFGLLIPHQCPVALVSCYCFLYICVFLQ